MALGVCNCPANALPKSVLQMGLAAKILARTWLQSCCQSHPALMGARVRGQSFRCPCHGVPGGQDPQEEVWPGVHPHQLCCPGHRKSPLGAAGKTAQGKAQPVLQLAIMANLCYTP